MSSPSSSSSSSSSSSFIAASPRRLARSWSDLSSDLLISIFSRPNTNSADLIFGVSSVCSSWRSTAKKPHCWRVMDFSDWDSVVASVSGPVSFTQVFNRALGFVNGEGELIEEVHFPAAAIGEDLILVSHRLPNLRFLSFPSHEYDPANVSTYLENFRSLKGIAVAPLFFSQLNSDLTSNVITNLSELKLLPDTQHDFTIYSPSIISICKALKSLSKLKKLEMPGLPISTNLILMLLDSLPDLEYLDISGYSNSRISKEVLEKSKRLKEFVWDSGRDLGEFAEFCEESHHEMDASTLCRCMFEERVMEWLTDE